MASFFIASPRRGLARLVLPAALAFAALSPARAATTVDLADKPLFSTVSVPGNLLLTLSVEYPTASTIAYSTSYSTSTAYLGYFDPNKCYAYNYNSTTPTSSYFSPSGTATSYACGGTAWSGNYLNWASMQSLDIFRWVLTGGNRSVDTTTSTVLTKTYHSGQDGGGSAPNKSLSSSTTISGATPLTWSALNTRIWGMGIKMLFTNSGTVTNAVGTQTSVDYTGGTVDSSKVYALYMNVQVCNSTYGVESNCVQYGTSYKPEGLMQQYSSSLRYGAFGYLNDTNVLRDGGVLRAGMKFIGPTQPVPGSTAITNSLAEWSSSTGIMVANPNPSDATATTTATSNAVTISQSGVMNYLNKFGYASSSYKQYDPVSELYYAAIRYLKNQAFVPEYSSMTGASTVTMTTWLDGFPVITTLTDPILYSCQKNFVLGIGDENTHRDADLPGSKLIPNSGQEPTEPTTVASDTTIDVNAATNMVGQLEGVSKLGTTYVNSGRYDTYFIAGLAYDAHVNNIRSDLTTGTTTKVTVDTYWLDVLESQIYEYNNIYYYATKYGGFTVPSSFSEYATTNGTSTIAQSAWHTNSDTESQGTTATTNLRPDNFFTANNPTVMQSSLKTAFANISAAAQKANSTTIATPTVNVATSGTVSYSVTYDPSTWTGELIASPITFASDGTATVGTAYWDARTWLTSASQSSRKIVTCCTTSTSAPGLAFTTAALTGSTLISRTNYTSFASVPGISGTQSAANFLLYLRGDSSQEVVNGGNYRTRTYRLGDIVDSKPLVLGAPSFLFYDSTNPGYSAFKLKYASRGTVVYAGANDGMLHAFDGSTGNSGAELFGYVPSFVYGTSTTATTVGLPTLGNPSFTHHYFVDGTPVESDVDFYKTQSPTATTNDWHSLLVGGLGKGGTGYYALDVTDPTTWTSESAVAGKVLWEFTDSRMGYSYGQPTIVKTKKYGWVVILTSGYNNTDGVGYFFFVNPRTGALLEAVATSAGSTSSPINLAQTTAYVSDYTDMTADALYAGDNLGNVWRVDLTGTSGSYSTATKIASLVVSSTGQPITTHVLTEVQSSTNVRYVLFGTGRLLADSDINSGAQQSFYAIVDGTGTFGGFYSSASLPSGVTWPVTRSQLNAVTSLTTGVSSSPTSVMGWYFDLPITNSIASRVNIDPTADSGVVAFAGNLPNGTTCSPSGVGTDYAVNFATGKTVLQDSSGNLLSSYSPGSGLITEVAILRVGGTLRLYSGTSTAGAAKVPASLSTASGVKQLNWHDVSPNN